MNLRVDLILESEQRSGSWLNPKSLLRMCSILVPVLVVAFLAMNFLAVDKLRRDLEDLQMDWDVTQPQWEKAKTLIDEFQSHREIAKEIQGWRLSRINWTGQLLGLMENVPANIKLDTLSVGHSLRLVDDKKPARAYTLATRGRAVGEDAQESVKALEKALRGAPAFTSVTAEVTVPLFAADTSPDADPEDRVFEIRCAYKEQLFDEAPRRPKRAN